MLGKREMVLQSQGDTSTGDQTACAEYEGRRDGMIQHSLDRTDSPGPSRSRRCRFEFGNGVRSAGKNPGWLTEWR